MRDIDTNYNPIPASGEIHRREALKKTMILMGGVISAPTMAGLLQGCAVTNEPEWTPEFMTMDQAKVINALVDTILPTTDTPGAVEVGVPKFIDTMLLQVYPEETQIEFNEGLAAWEARAEEEQGRSFARLDEEQRTAMVMAIHEEATNGEGDDGGVQDFLMRVKEITVAGYCTSEAGATMVLRYDKTPGDYKGCIPFEEVGKTWAT